MNLLPSILLLDVVVALLVPSPIRLSYRASSPSSGSALHETYKPVFDLSDPDSVDAIDRLDDAIMGGISTSSVIAAKDEKIAKWFGVCRTDGGGFCGFRTNPFREPLMVGDSDGFYIEGRLSSDDEPERRVWKFTTRIKPDRGEVVYQAPFVLGTDWSRIQIPFDSFKLVRGPRQVPDAPPLNTTGGIYQMGMTMSKFAMGLNTTELPNFRHGFFEVQLKEIGFYKKDPALLPVETPKVLSKEEAKSKRPLLLKILLPVAKLFFSEKSQRRKSAMKILREKRGLSRGQAILFGLRMRCKSLGLARSLTKTGAIIGVDSFRATALTFLRIFFITPLGFLRKVYRKLTGSTKPEPLSV